MSRDASVRLLDIVDAAARVDGYLRGQDFAAFCADRRTFDAVVRNLEIIGEAAKGVDQETRRRLPSVPFVSMAGMRDVLIHGYHGVDEELVWDAATRVLPESARAIRVHLGAS